MKIHHIGYLVKDIRKSTEEFLKLGYMLEQESRYDDIRKASINFLVNENYRIELIEPDIKAESPLVPLLKRFKNAPYHICYETEDLKKSIEDLTGKGYMVTSEPAPASCIEGRKVAFLMSPAAGLIELLEKEK